MVENGLVSSDLVDASIGIYIETYRVREELWGGGVSIF